MLLCKLKQLNLFELWTLLFYNEYLCLVDENCWKCRNESFVSATVPGDSAVRKLEKQGNHDNTSPKGQHENGPWKQITGRTNNYLLKKASFQQQVFWKINLLNVKPQKLANRKGDLTKTREKYFLELTWGRGEVVVTTHTDRFTYFGFIFLQ